MSEFSNILSQFIHEKNIKVYPLSKYCDFDRATMYKIINGKRNPPSRDIIEKMSDFMRLTPTEDVQKIFSCIFRINFLFIPAPPLIPISKMNPGRLPVPQFRHR